jgi:glycosyltransferase involved in cell wall biosynthesis
MSLNKKSVLFVIDKPNWAYHIISKFVASELSDQYDFYFDFQIKNSKTLKGQVYNLYSYILKLIYRRVRKDSTYDISCFLWWKSKDLYTEKITVKKSIVGIFTEGFPPGGSEELKCYTQANFVDDYLEQFDAIACGNRNIYNSYKKFNKQCFYATGGVNLELFNKIPKSDNEFVIAWTGNPNRKFKGYNDYILPAIKDVQKSRPNIKFKTRFSGPHETLPDFYSSVDLLINASIADAGPGFMVEAGACGVPTVSTPGGFADELIINRKNGSIVERDINAIASEIIYLFDNRDVLNTMKHNIQKDIVRHWGTESRAIYWEKMFSELLKSTHKQ